MVNMIIDTFAAAALASLPPNPKVMNEMPRKSTDFIISPKMRNYILGIGLSFTVLLLGLMYWFTINDGVMSRLDLSVFFTTFVMLQFWNMFNAKAFSFSWLCIQEFKGQYRFPDRYVYHSHRAVFDCTIRRRGIPYRSFKLERLGDHCRFDFAGTVDR